MGGQRSRSSSAGLILLNWGNYKNTKFSRSWKKYLQTSSRWYSSTLHFSLQKGHLLSFIPKSLSFTVGQVIGAHLN